VYDMIVFSIPLPANAHVAHGSSLHVLTAAIFAGLSLPTDADTSRTYDEYRRL